MNSNIRSVAGQAIQLLILRSHFALNPMNVNFRILGNFLIMGFKCLKRIGSHNGIHQF
jgi:hypothetical protein